MLCRKNENILQFNIILTNVAQFTAKTSAHFLLPCSNYSNERLTFLNIIRDIDRNILNKNGLKVTKTLPYGGSSLDHTNNTLIMNATMEFLFASKRFDVPLV